MIDHVQQIADIIRFAAEYTPYWTDDPATHQDPYENAAKALVEAGYVKVEEYEYAIQMEDTLGSGPYTLGKYFGADRGYWGSIEDRQTELDWYVAEFPTSKFWLVKRRKAGKVEEA